MKINSAFSNNYYFTRTFVFQSTTMYLLDKFYEVIIFMSTNDGRKILKNLQLGIMCMYVNVNGGISLSTKVKV